METDGRGRVSGGGGGGGGTGNRRTDGRMSGQAGGEEGKSAIEGDPAIKTGAFWGGDCSDTLNTPNIIMN